MRWDRSLARPAEALKISVSLVRGPLAVAGDRRASHAWIGIVTRPWALGAGPRALSIGSRQCRVLITHRLMAVPEALPKKDFLTSSLERRAGR